MTSRAFDRPNVWQLEDGKAYSVMAEPFGLVLNYTTAAAKLAAALWIAQACILFLRRGRAVPAWQIALGLLTFVASSISWRQQPVTAWLIACGLALFMLVDGLRLWMSQPNNEPTTKLTRLPLVSLSLSVVGCGLCTMALITAPDAAKVNGQPHVMMVISLLSLFFIFGILAASTLELTVGSTGSALLALPWQRLSTAATFAFLLEIILAGWVISKLQPNESVELTAAPVLYEFSRLLLGYIAWCVPRRMVILTQKNELRGQASLALSGWIALICFALAMALPTGWPWYMLTL